MSQSLKVLNPVALLPDEQIIAVTPNKEFVPVKVEYYPAGEPMIKDVGEGEISALIVRPWSLDVLLAALFFIEASEDRGYPGIDLILPYFPGARQDRLNVEGDLLFTARSVARLINNTPNILTVKILDPHSEVTPALLNRLEVFDSTFVWGPNQDWSGWDYDGVIAPDGGAVKRAYKVAELLNTRVVLHGWKHREVGTGEIYGFGLETPHKAGHYLVVDDICDGGGTFLGLAKEFEKHGITADLFVTHGIFSRATNLYMLNKAYGKIYCSDSLIIPGKIKEEVHVIPVVERMLGGSL